MVQGQQAFSGLKSSIFAPNHTFYLIFNSCISNIVLLLASTRVKNCFGALNENKDVMNVKRNDTENVISELKEKMKITLNKI